MREGACVVHDAVCFCCTACNSTNTLTLSLASSLSPTHASTNTPRGSPLPVRIHPCSSLWRRLYEDARASCARVVVVAWCSASLAFSVCWNHSRGNAPSKENISTKQGPRPGLCRQEHRITESYLVCVLSSASNRKKEQACYSSLCAFFGFLWLEPSSFSTQTERCVFMRGSLLLLQRVLFFSNFLRQAIYSIWKLPLLRTVPFTWQDGQRDFSWMPPQDLLLTLIPLLRPCTLTTLWPCWTK